MSSEIQSQEGQVWACGVRLEPTVYYALPAQRKHILNVVRNSARLPLWANNIPGLVWTRSIEGPVNSGTEKPKPVWNRRHRQSPDAYARKKRIRKYSGKNIDRLNPIERARLILRKENIVQRRQTIRDRWYETNVRSKEIPPGWEGKKRGPRSRKAIRLRKVKARKKAYTLCPYLRVDPDRITWPKTRFIKVRYIPEIMVRERMRTRRGKPDRYIIPHRRLNTLKRVGYTVQLGEPKDTHIKVVGGVTVPLRHHKKYWYFYRKTGTWRTSEHHPYGDESLYGN